MKKLLLILGAVVLFGVFPLRNVQAAQIYFEPQPAEYRVGDSISLSLFLDTENESINAVEINILVPELLRVKSISKNGSAIQLWVSEPSFSSKTVSLAGGIPGGLIGSKALIAKVFLEAAAVGEGNIAFMPGSAVLLNDGQGTKLDLKIAGGPAFKVIPRPKGVPADTLKSEESSPESIKEKAKKEDKKKPEKFEILFGKDPRVFGDNNFISFFTIDADSGVDRYEVKLGKELFKIAQSPYLIKDIAPRTVVKVRAYDLIGNYRESTYPSLLKRIWWRLITLVPFF